MSGPLKVLLLATHLEMGGIPVYVVSLAQGLKRRGHEPVVASAGGWLEGSLAAEGIPHVRVPCNTSSELNPKLWLRAFPELLRQVRRDRPDLIHAHTRVAQVMAWALHMRTGIPFVTTCHGLYQFRIGRRFFRCWGKWVMAISRPSMERLVEQYRLAPPHQVVLIWNGVDVRRFQEPPLPEEVDRFRQVNGLSGEPVVGAVARLSPVKGLDVLLRAVPPLLKEFPRLQVLLVGDGPERSRLTELAYELGIAGRVVISHPVQDTRVPLAAMRVFVAPTFREGFGLAIAEAMAAGVPVVVTNAGGPGEIVEDGVSGLVIPPKDPQAVQAAVRTLLKDPQRWARMAEAGRLRARERFDLERMVGEVEQVYVRVVA